MRNKYGNKKTVICGRTFDSQREAFRYLALQDELKRGVITTLQLQYEFILAPGVVINGRKRPPLRYRADFIYWRDGKQIVEDAKGRITEGYRIKRHLMKSVHSIDILET